MKTWTTSQLLGGMAAVAILGTVVGAGLSRPPAGADITEPGSPLYNIAVTESIKGLSGEKEEPAAAKPCPDCGKVHAPAVPDVAKSAGGESSEYFLCDHCNIYHRRPVQVQIGDASQSAPTPPPPADVK